MRALTTMLMVLLLTTTASADSFGTLGCREDTVIQDDTDDDCFGTPIYNHDMSFENGYCWQYEGVAPPYYGAFAEGYDLGLATVECGLYWLTEIGYGVYAIVDVYLWQGGITTPPVDVLFVQPEVNLGFMASWPHCTLCEAAIECCVDGEFTVGFWAESWHVECIWYVCVDESGPAGHPWTCIAPGLGYPTGWNHPNVVFPDCVSMGIGVTVTEEPSPPESPTWGSIKALFSQRADPGEALR